MNYLSDKHLNKLKSSAIQEDYIKSSKAETINLETILNKGFKALTPDAKESLLQDKSRYLFSLFSVLGGLPPCHLENYLGHLARAFGDR